MGLKAKDEDEEEEEEEEAIWKGYERERERPVFIIFYVKIFQNWRKRRKKEKIVRVVVEKGKKMLDGVVRR